jgi:hypothetical protein
MTIQATQHFARRPGLAVAMGLLIWCGAARAGETELLTAPVRLVTSSDDHIFPELWRKTPINAKGEALAEGDFERVSAVFKRAFAKYPEAILTKNLKAVYVLSELKYSGVVAAGTNSTAAAYVKVGEIKKGYTDAGIEYTFHAEFSSILLRNRGTDFDAAAWQKLNPPDFKYSVGGVGAIRQGKASLQPDENLFRQGFRNQYAQSSLENDFNGYAAGLFMGDKQLWELAEKHAAIKGKLTITIAFYHAVEASLTEKHFRELVPK